MLNLNLKNLDVWKKSLDIVSEIYKLTNCFPTEELFVLTYQLRKAAISIPSNISEGFARISEPETRRFLDIARSSLVEIDTQIDISLLLKYLTEDQLKKLSEFANHEFAMLTNLIKKYTSKR